MRTMTFDMISDSRFTPDVLADNKSKVYRTCAALSNMTGVYFNHDEPRVIYFDKGDTVSIRCKFYVQRDKGIKAADIQREINAIYAPYYRWI